MWYRSLDSFWKAKEELSKEIVIEAAVLNRL